MKNVPYVPPNEMFPRAMNNHILPQKYPYGGLHESFFARKQAPTLESDTSRI